MAKVLFKIENFIITLLCENTLFMSETMWTFDALLLLFYFCTAENLNFQENMLENTQDANINPNPEQTGWYYYVYCIGLVIDSIP